MSSHPKTCGPCDDCAEALHDYASIPEYADAIGVARHPDEDETAAAVRIYDEAFVAGELWRGTTYGLGRATSSPEPDGLVRGRQGLDDFRTDAPRGRRTTPQLAADVRYLRARGYLVPAIADALNLSDARVRRLAVT